MRIAALEEDLKKLSEQELDEVSSALELLCKKLPEQLIQELGLRTLWNIVKLAKLDKKSRAEGGTNDKNP